MYVNAINPVQSWSWGQGVIGSTLKSGATIYPTAAFANPSGNAISYSFNPTYNPGYPIAHNPALAYGHGNVMAISPAFSTQSWLNPGFTSHIISTPLANQSLSYSNQMMANQMLPQQSLSSLNMNMGGINTIQSYAGMSQPRIDLAETNSDVVIAAELPNVSLNDLNLTVTDDSITISATAFSGASTTSLFRTIPLPTNVRAEHCDASYSNGILEVRLPKSDVATRRRLKVNVTQ